MFYNTNKKQLFVGLLFIFTEHLKLNKMKKQKYEIGDVVIITSKRHGHRFNISDVVTIVKRDPLSDDGLGDYLAKIDTKDEEELGWWIMDDEIN